jgi:hypothetical protein
LIEWKAFQWKALIQWEDKEHPHNDIYDREVHEQGPQSPSRLDIPISIADIFLICLVV